MTGIEIAAVAAAVGIAKNLKDLTSSLGGSVPPEVRDQILALFDRVVDIQTEVVTALDRNIKLTDRCRELEDQLKRVENWEAEKARYALQRVGSGGTAYRLKPSESETDHFLCPNCFEDQKKSYLQRQGVKWTCPRCTVAFSARVGGAPPRPGRRPSHR